MTDSQQKPSKCPQCGAPPAIPGLDRQNWKCLSEQYRDDKFFQSWACKRIAALQAVVTAAEAVVGEFYAEVGDDLMKELVAALAAVRGGEGEKQG